MNVVSNDAANRPTRSRRAPGLPNDGGATDLAVSSSGSNSELRLALDVSSSPRRSSSEHDAERWPLDSLEPGTVLNGYRIERIVGRGGMGVIYKARDQSLYRPVAIKVITADALKTPKQAERFEQEAQLLAQLEHPNIVQVYQLGSLGSRRYLVMQWIEGTTLKAWATRYGRNLPTEAALDLLIQICRGLRVAHDRDIVHRDIKPDNILLTPDGQVKLVDFGLAKHHEVDRNLSTSGFLIGTPAYAAPEQIEGRECDARTDLYALGIVAFELFAGEHPYPTSSTARLLFHQVSSPLPSLSALNPNVPPDLEALIRRLGAKNPTSRPRSASVVEKELLALRERVVAGEWSEPVDAAPDVRSGYGSRDVAQHDSSASQLEPSDAFGANRVPVREVEEAPTEFRIEPWMIIGPILILGLLLAILLSQGRTTKQAPTTEGGTSIGPCLDQDPGEQAQSYRTRFSFTNQDAHA